jgi:hypothetical protein
LFESSKCEGRKQWLVRKSKIIEVFEHVFRVKATLIIAERIKRSQYRNKGNSKTLQGHYCQTYLKTKQTKKKVLKREKERKGIGSKRLKYMFDV